DRSLRDPHAIAEQGHFLRVDRHHDLQRTLRRFAEPRLFLRLGFFPFDPCGAVFTDGDVHSTHEPATGRIKQHAVCGVRRMRGAGERERSNRAPRKIRAMHTSWIIRTTDAAPTPPPRLPNTPPHPPRRWNGRSGPTVSLIRAPTLRNEGRRQAVNASLYVARW